jgi:hypothetical protein
VPSSPTLIFTQEDDTRFVVHLVVSVRYDSSIFRSPTSLFPLLIVLQVLRPGNFNFIDRRIWNLALDMLWQDPPAFFLYFLSLFTRRLHVLFHPRLVRLFTRASSLVCYAQIIHFPYIVPKNPVGVDDCLSRIKLFGFYDINLLTQT